MREVISIVGGKGGVGKTIISVNMAHSIAGYGVKTLLVDCDINTYGATMFYRLADLIPKDLNEVVTMKKILQSIIDADIFEEHLVYANCKGLNVAENLDVIPAVNDLEHSEVLNDSKENLEKIKKTLCDLIQMWSEKYEVIIFDHSAGYNNLLDVMISISTKIVLVRESNLLSLQAARGLYKKLQSLDIPIVGYINKIPREDYKAVLDVSEGIIPECAGFKNEEIIAKKTAMGELLCQPDSLKYTCGKEYADTMERMIVFLLPEFKDIKKEYEEELDKKKEEERNRELRKKEKEEQEKYRKSKKYFGMYHRVFVPVCILITVVFLIIIGKGIKLLFPVLVATMLGLIIIGGIIIHKLDLYDELAKYYSDIIDKVIKRIKQIKDIDDEMENF